MGSGQAGFALDQANIKQGQERIACSFSDALVESVDGGPAEGLDPFRFDVTAAHIYKNWELSVALRNVALPGSLPVRVYVHNKDQTETVRITWEVGVQSIDVGPGQFSKFTIDDVGQISIAVLANTGLCDLFILGS